VIGQHSITQRLHLAAILTFGRRWSSGRCRPDAADAV